MSRDNRIDTLPRESGMGHRSHASQNQRKRGGKISTVFILSLLLGSLLGAIPTVQGDAPAKIRVVVSIKPIHSLIAGVMQGIAHPILLVPGNASPHTYTLQPTAARQLQNAEVLFWVGAELETFLTRTVANLPDQVERVALLTAAKLPLLPNRGGAHTTATQEKQEHQHGDIDPHVWLDPSLAQKIVSLAGTVLIQRFPAFSKQFQENVTRMQQRLQQLDRDLQQQLAPVRQIPFLVYHDAYHYFENHFDLHSTGAVTLNPDRPAGARHISTLRHDLQASKAVCLFTEPQFHVPIIQTVTEGLAIKVGTLDPLGASLPEGTELYFQLLHAMADSMKTCLLSKP